MFVLYVLKAKNLQREQAHNMAVSSVTKPDKIKKDILIYLDWFDGKNFFPVS